MSQITNTLIIGKVLYELNECESTNLYAKELIAKSKPPNGTVVLTDNQTAGRGQFGNFWQSEPHQNIALSIILFPKLKIKEQFFLSKTISLACVKALKSITNLDFEIKWPNDIYYKNQKVGGILIENQVIGNDISNSVVGVGINLNQESFENLPQATSIYRIVKYLLSRKKVTEILLQHFDVEYIKLTQLKFKEIDLEYHQHLKSLHQEFNFKENNLEKTGVLKGVNVMGQLIVEVNNETRLFDFKEIEWLF